MATHASVLAWRITWTEEPGGLQYTGSHRVRHNWSDFACIRRSFYILNSILTTDLKSHLLIPTYELSQIQSLWYVFSFANGSYFPVILTFALYPGYCKIMLWTFWIWLYSPKYRHIFVLFFFFFCSLLGCTEIVNSVSWATAQISFLFLPI